MLALSLMLSVTYYAQNYAGIISWSLTLDHNSNNYNLVVGTTLTPQVITYTYGSIRASENGALRFMNSA